MSRRARSPLALRATWLATVVAGRLSRRLAGPFARTLWFTPWRVPVGERERNRRAGWLDGTRQVRIRAGDVDLAGFATGDGPVVLLVHGWGEEAASLGAYVQPLVAAGFRVVGLDLPGHGASGDGPTNLYTLGGAIRDAASQVDARAVIAHSMGSASTMLAIREGLELDAVAFLAPPVRLEHALEQFTKMFRIPPKAVVGLRDTIEREFGADVWADTSGDLLAPSLDVPALIVHDRDDPQVPLADAELLAGVWPGSRLEVTEGFGHTKLMRAGVVVNEVVHFLLGALGPDSRKARRRATEPMITTT